MYEAMEEAEVIETKTFVELAREYPCAYIVLKEDREMTQPLTEYGSDPRCLSSPGEGGKRSPPGIYSHCHRRNHRTG